MRKQKPSKPERERIDISLTAIFEGDSCEVVCINCPHLSWVKTVCLGEKLILLGHLLEDREKAHQMLESFSKAISDLMYGGEL